MPDVWRQRDGLLSMPRNGFRSIRIVWRCPRCPETMELAELFDHLRDVHGIDRTGHGTRWVKTDERLRREQTDGATGAQGDS